ncbi:hypothetical protein GWI33_020495 [Rhynchophorus ferrugineus]|uniref:Uncharacterized protein n=1 Tax=Rhynchophorus ferrugineus TaxID=354439 RepID=A0A834HQV4_RHYFE|nr:hypothetical protein GWI33_020495 [Rhynchophorus ferrugineus]
MEEMDLYRLNTGVQTLLSLALGKSLADIINFNNSAEEALLKSMLTYDPAKRKTARELLKSNYLKTARLTTPDLTAFPTEEPPEAEAGPS